MITWNGLLDILAIMPAFGISYMPFVNSQFLRGLQFVKYYKLLSDHWEPLKEYRIKSNLRYQARRATFSQ